MRYRILIAPEAEGDLRSASNYIRRDNPHAAGAWLKGIRQRIKTLAQYPERCALAPESASFHEPIRELFYGGGNRGTYRILFVVLDKMVSWCIYVTGPCRPCDRMSDDLRIDIL